MAPKTDLVPWRERAFLQMLTAAEIAGVSVTTLYRLHEAKKLVLRDLAGRTVVDVPSFIVLLENLPAWTPRPRGVEARAKRSEIAAKGRL